MRGGFTLIETLAALLLLAIVVPVALETQILAIKMERKARAAEAVTREIDRVLMKSICGSIATNRPEHSRPACDINETVFHLPSGMDANAVAGMISWEISPANDPSFKVILFTRPDRE